MLDHKLTDPVTDRESLPAAVDQPERLLNKTGSANQRGGRKFAVLFFCKTGTQQPAETARRFSENSAEKSTGGEKGRNRA